MRQGNRIKEELQCKRWSASLVCLFVCLFVCTNKTDTLVTPSEQHPSQPVLCLLIFSPTFLSLLVLPMYLYVSAFVSSLPEFCFSLIFVFFKSVSFFFQTLTLPFSLSFCLSLCQTLISIIYLCPWVVFQLFINLITSIT